ncbi:MAG: molybdenum cofactor guanylyltransferase [Bacteroidota bacterium]
MAWKYRHITGVLLVNDKKGNNDEKSLSQFDGKPLIQHISETLQEIFEKVIIISDFPEKYQFLKLPIYPEILKNCDPLGAIHSALINVDTEEVFIISSDIPFIRKDIINYVLKKENGADISVMATEGNVHPCCGLYKSSCILPIAMNYTRGFVSMQSLLDQVSIQEITPDAAMQQMVTYALGNVNPPRINSTLVSLAG